MFNMHSISLFCAFEMLVSCLRGCVLFMYVSLTESLYMTVRAGAGVLTRMHVSAIVSVSSKRVHMLCAVTYVHSM